jgi:hypothetical protein
MNQLKANYKTLIPAVVASGVLLYEAITGHQVDKYTQEMFVNDSIAIVGFMISFGGILCNHFHKPAAPAAQTENKEVQK